MLSYHPFFISILSSIMSVNAFISNKSFAKTDHLYLVVDRFSHQSFNYYRSFCGYMAVARRISRTSLLAVRTPNNLKPAE